MVKTFGSTAARAIRTAAGKADSRARMVKAIRAACRRLGIDDDDRRAVQADVTGLRSTGDMTLAQLGQVLDRLNRDWHRGGPRAHVGKIRALWWTLYWLGAIDQPTDEAVNAFVKRQSGRERIQFLGPRDAFRVIEALKSWAAREGVNWPTQAEWEDLRAYHPALTIVQLERHAVAEAIGAKLASLGRLKSSWSRYCEKAIGLHCNYRAWTIAELDDCIRTLGKMLRRALDKRGEE